MPLLLIIITLTEPRRKGRRLIPHIEMGDIAVAPHPEACNSFSAFFRDERGNRSWCRAQTMPEYHRGDTDQMTDQDAAKPKMAEENDRVSIWLLRAVEMSVTHVTV